MKDISRKLTFSLPHIIFYSVWHIHVVHLWREADEIYNVSTSLMKAQVMTFHLSITYRLQFQQTTSRILQNPNNPWHLFITLIIHQCHSRAEALIYDRGTCITSILSTNPTNTLTFALCLNRRFFYYIYIKSTYNKQAHLIGSRPTTFVGSRKYMSLQNGKHKFILIIIIMYYYLIVLIVLFLMRSAMVFLMTTESQDLGLTSHPKDGAFWQYSVPVTILGR